MADAPTTRPSLLVRLRDAGDDQAWQQFVELYGPLIYQFARRRGLQDADAADVTQEVLRGVHGAAGRLDYDPAKGTFRAWLFTLARRRLADFHRRRTQAGRAGVPEAMLEGLAAGDEAEAWDRDYHQRLFDWAAEQVRPQVADTTWQAFWLTAVDGCSGQDAAERLGLSVAAVYLAKGRVMLRLREMVATIDQE